MPFQNEYSYLFKLLSPAANTFFNSRSIVKLPLYPDLERAKTDPRARLKNVNVETKEALAELDKTYQVPELSKNDNTVPAKADKFNAAHYSTGRVAASFTSTAFVRETVHEAAVLEDDVVRSAILPNL